MYIWYAFINISSPKIQLSIVQYNMSFNIRDCWNTYIAKSLHTYTFIKHNFDLR